MMDDTIIMKKFNNYVLYSQYYCTQLFISYLLLKMTNNSFALWSWWYKDFFFK